MNYSELVARNSRGQEVEQMETTWADQIEQKARSRGLIEGFRRSIGLMLEKRFGRLDAASRRRLEAIDDVAELERLGERLLSAKSLAELGLAP